MVRAKSRFHRLHPSPPPGHRCAPSNRVVQGSANVLTGGAGEGAGEGQRGGIHGIPLCSSPPSPSCGRRGGETHDDDGNGQDDDGDDSLTKGLGRESTAWPCAIPPLVPLRLQSVDGFAGVYWIDDGRPDPCPAGKRHLHHAQRLAVAGATSKSLPLQQQQQQQRAASGGGSPLVIKQKRRTFVRSGPDRVPYWAREREREADILTVSRGRWPRTHTSFPAAVH